MPTHLGWDEIALRLTLTAIAGTLIGLDRGAHGRPAGLRTTLLVCLAAAISMIQANLLLATDGKPPGSFVTLDLMRLPLGILTGMGFIGAGAILKKGDTIVGVTTAATLWFVTVIGLCFGGGQIALGGAALAMGMIVLKGLKRLEHWLPQDQRAKLTLTVSAEGPTPEEICEDILERGFHVLLAGIRHDSHERSWMLCGEVRWRSRPTDPTLPTIVKDLSRRPGVSRVEWHPLGVPSEGSGSVRQNAAR